MSTSHDDTQTLSAKAGSLLRQLSLPTLLIGLTWANLYFLVGENNNLRALMLLFVTSSIGCYIVARTVVPGFVGSLAVGIMIANIPPRFGGDIDQDYKSAISSIALVLILSRAGMGLDVATVKSRIGVLVWVSVMPNVIDIVVGMLLARAFFTSPQLPWKWCALVGFIVPAVSPAVVVPGSLTLQKEGYGVKKGITTIVLAATALGDVFAIAGFSVCVSLVFQKDTNVGWSIGKVPLEILAGIVAGAVTGYALTWLFPSSLPLSPVTRCALLLGFGGAAVLGGKKIEWSAAGSLFVLVLGVACAQRWDEEVRSAISAHLVSLWNYIVSPMLFATIGATVDFKLLTATDVGFSCALIAVTVCCRAVFTTLATPTCAFTWKEKGFMACAWMPKATVQAALASVPLNLAKEGNASEGDNTVKFGRAVLAVGVAAIILTAPVGAVLIKIAGRKWLTKDVDEAEQEI